MKKIGILILLMAWLAGGVGGFSALCYHKEFALAIASLAVIFLSLPAVIELWKDLTE